MNSRRPALRLLELRARPLDGDEIRVPLSGAGPRGRDLAAPSVLRAALDGLDPASPTPGLRSVVLELEVGRHRFRVERGGVARLIRIEDGVEEAVAEGDHDVTELVARLAGASEPLGRRAVARATDVAAWLREELAGGSAGRVHAGVTAELRPAAIALGGRMRELLQRAQGLLQDATDEIAPGRESAMAPEDLGARRDELVGVLRAAAGRLETLDEAVDAADAMSRRVRERHDRMQEYLHAEQLGRKLERQKHLMEAQRRRLERARAAARVSPRAPGGGDPAEAERKAREVAERGLETARAELSAARAAHAAEDARSAERDAVAAWIERLREHHGALVRLHAARARLIELDGRTGDLEAAEREAADGLEEAAAAIDAAVAAIEAIAASPEEAAAAHAEATRAARLAADVRRLFDVRDELRVRARDLQIAKIGVERVEEELELAHRELEWNRTSSQPRPASELPSVAALTARRTDLLATVEEASRDLAATREELRRRTTELGTQAYLSPDLLEAEAREKAAHAARFGAAGQDRDSVEAELERLRQRATALAAQRERASADIGTLSLTRLQVRDEIGRLEEAIPLHLQADGAIPAALAAAHAELTQRDEARVATRAHLQRAEAETRRAEDALRAARAAEEAAARRLVDVSGGLAPLREAGFATWQELEEARLPPDELRALQAEIDEHEALERRVAAGRQIGEDDSLLPRADPAQAELMRALVAHAHELGTQRRDRLAQELAAIDRWLDALDEIAAELESLEEAAGLAGGAERSGVTFEERALEGLARRVLARTRVRLEGWQRDWTLEWSTLTEDAAPRGLVVTDGATARPLAPAEALEATWLAAALAVELAMAGEPVSLETLMVEGSGALPADESGPRLVPA